MITFDTEIRVWYVDTDQMGMTAGFQIISNIFAEGVAHSGFLHQKSIKKPVAITLPAKEKIFEPKLNFLESFI